MGIIRFGILSLLFSFLIISCSKDDEKGDSSVSIKTFDVQVLNYKSIKSGGVIESSSTQVIQRGVCYGENPQPTIVGTITKDGTGLGSFNSNVTQLKAKTQYYLRAYMVNEKGTFYGNELTFTTQDYPTKNIWKLNDQTFVINDQSIVPFLKWEGNVLKALDDAVTEVNGLSLTFKHKPTVSGVYTFVKKDLSELQENECLLNIVSSRKNYVGQYTYLSSTPQTFQVNVNGGKTEVSVPEMNVYSVSDSILSNPVKFSAILIEK